VQVILESPFTSVCCISWQQETGKVGKVHFVKPNSFQLAVCFEANTIYIYSPVQKRESNEDKVKWVKTQEIVHFDSKINCISWRPNSTGNHLLVTGSSIILWELTETV
jgi:WD40 repeat protein